MPSLHSFPICPCIYTQYYQFTIIVVIPRIETSHFQLPVKTTIIWGDMTCLLTKHFAEISYHVSEPFPCSRTFSGFLEVPYTCHSIKVNTHQDQVRMWPSIAEATNIYNINSFLFFFCFQSTVNRTSIMLDKILLNSQVTLTSLFTVQMLLDSTQTFYNISLMTIRKAFVYNVNVVIT